MNRYYRERLHFVKDLSAKVALYMEVNKILETMREEARKAISSAMEVCILLLDPDALKYTRPLACALYNRPVNCLLCKKSREAVQKALNRKKGVVLSNREPIARHDGARLRIGPEAALPVFVNGDILAVVDVVSRPGTRFTKRDFYLIRDLSEMAGNAIYGAKKHWEVTQEKIAISRKLTHLFPFVPRSVRHIVENNPEILTQEKTKRDVTVLFLDLEDYTRLSQDRPESEINELVEEIFSSFVDPIHRSGGDINETAGDGLMIIFKNDDARTNAVNAVRAALDICRKNKELAEQFSSRFEKVTVNMGINSGTALLGMTRLAGSLETRMTYTATGPVTNLAARLADHARGGDVLLGEETRRLIEGIWPVHDRGEVLLKGIGSLKIYSLTTT